MAKWWEIALGAAAGGAQIALDREVTVRQAGTEAAPSGGFQVTQPRERIQLPIEVPTRVEPSIGLIALVGGGILAIILFMRKRPAPAT